MNGERGNDDPRPVLPPGDDPRAGWPIPSMLGATPRGWLDGYRASTGDRSRPWRVRPGRWCLICGRLLPRRWWQRGAFLRPLPLCHRRDALACQERAVARR